VEQPGVLQGPAPKQQKMQIKILCAPFPSNVFLISKERESGTAHNRPHNTFYFFLIYFIARYFMRLQAFAQFQINARLYD
jgi:hypothetical protein